jgi:hypothetical protein
MTTIRSRAPNRDYDRGFDETFGKKCRSCGIRLEDPGEIALGKHLACAETADATEDDPTGPTDPANPGVGE